MWKHCICQKHYFPLSYYGHHTIEQNVTVSVVVYSSFLDLERHKTSLHRV